MHIGALKTTNSSYSTA